MSRARGAVRYIRRPLRGPAQLRAVIEPAQVYDVEMHCAAPAVATCFVPTLNQSASQPKDGAAAMTLNGTKQITQSVEIDASTDTVWEILSDSRLLPHWVPAVEEVTSCSLDGEGVGTTRSCTANLAGKSGTMVERCIEYTPKTRLAYLVDDETFGMHKMFDHYGFSLDLAALDPGQQGSTADVGGVG